MSRRCNNAQVPSSTSDSSDLDRLVSAVRDSRKYARVVPGLVSTIGAAELAKGTPLKEAIRATKNKLHQVGGMYVGAGAPPYARWLRQVHAASAIEVPGVLREIMSHHASTRERLPQLDRFYTTVFAGVGPVQSVLDLACGLNPLSIPWMPLAPGAVYHAVDIFADMMDFVCAVLPVLGASGKAEARDVLHDCPTEPVDVALLLKAIPCLEQLDKSAGARLVDTINARHIVVSFPTRSVGGRNVGMRATYEARFNKLIEGRQWRVARFELGTELVFRLSM
jgi:16S rRNA (guanine(1405)-N(7))-methyltransferase